MIQVSIQIVSMTLTEASFEVGPILGVIFAFLLIAFRIRSNLDLNEGKESDEERKQLRLEEIQTIMAIADQHLNEKLVYYQNLSVEGKKKFLRRLQEILATKIFIGKEGLKLTPEMELLTASAFVQVTFGLDRFRLRRFNRIVIYPNIFYNKLLDRNLRGSTSPIGVLRFSWKHIRHGYEVGDDNINLALHEIAHALKVSVDEEGYVDAHLNKEMREFFESGEEIRDAILNGKLALIRTYAATNEHEFFACCIEYFFESPEHFKRNLPELYDRICAILNQDPTNDSADYAVKEPKKPRVFLRRRKPEVSLSENIGRDRWVQGILGSGLMIGIGVSIFMIYLCQSSALSIWLFAATIMIVGIAIYYRRYLLSGYMSNFSFFIFLVMGWTPAIMSVAMVLNYLVPVYYFTQTDTVDRLKYENRQVMIVCKNSEVPNLKNGYPVEPYEASMVHNALPNVKCKTTLYYGMFGLINIESVQLIYGEHAGNSF